MSMTRKYHNNTYSIVRLSHTTVTFTILLYPIKMITKLERTLTLPDQTRTMQTQTSHKQFKQQRTGRGCCILTSTCISISSLIIEILVNKFIQKWLSIVLIANKEMKDKSSNYSNYSLLTFPFVSYETLRRFHFSEM